MLEAKDRVYCPTASLDVMVVDNKTNAKLTENDNVVLVLQKGGNTTVEPKLNGNTYTFSLTGLVPGVFSLDIKANGYYNLTESVMYPSCVGSTEPCVCSQSQIIKMVKLPEEVPCTDNKINVQLNGEEGILNRSDVFFTFYLVDKNAGKKEVFKNAKLPVLMSSQNAIQEDGEGSGSTHTPSGGSNRSAHHTTKGDDNSATRGWYLIISAFCFFFITGFFLISSF